MAASPKTQQAPGSKQTATGWKRGKGIYVYGILPADVELTSDMPGVGDPPGRVRVIRRGGLAALVSEVALSGRLGSPADLTAHQQILDACAAELPVLPLRFGAVLASEDAVAGELLEAHMTSSPTRWTRLTAGRSTSSRAVMSRR